MGTPTPPAAGRVVAVAEPQARVPPFQETHGDALVAVALQQVAGVLPRGEIIAAEYRAKTNVFFFSLNKLVQVHDSRGETFLNRLVRVSVPGAGAGKFTVIYILCVLKNWFQAGTSF